MSPPYVVQGDVGKEQKRVQQGVKRQVGLGKVFKIVLATKAETMLIKGGQTGMGGKGVLDYRR